MARNTKEKALETRERILNAAEDVFNDKGVSNTSLNDVAQAANVTRGAIYWHFKNKSDLFDAMCSRIRMPMRKMIEDMADKKTSDPLGQLRTGCAFVMQQVVENPHYRKVLTILFHKCEFLDANDPIHIYQKNWLVHGIDTVRNILENAKEKKQVPADLDIHTASILLHITFDGLLNSWLFMPERFDLIDAAAKINETVLDSIRTNPSLRMKVKLDT